MQDNEVIRILNELGFPVHRVSSSGRPEIRPRWEVMTDIIFHAMQRHVGEQGGKDRTLPCACLGGSEPAVIQHPRSQPAPDGPAEPGESLELAQECGLFDSIEAFRDVGIQAVLGLRFNRVEDGPDGIVYGSARAEAVAVGLSRVGTVTPRDQADGCASVRTVRAALTAHGSPPLSYTDNL